jgi:hypothetical protein
VRWDWYPLDRTPQRPANKSKDKIPRGLILPVPDDSVYMLLPLFAGETDSEFQPEDMAQYEVPLESRKYLLVYYVPFDKRADGWEEGRTADRVTFCQSKDEEQDGVLEFVPCLRT